MRVLLVGTHFAMYTCALLDGMSGLEARAYLSSANYQREKGAIKDDRVVLFGGAGFRKPVGLLRLVYQYIKLLWSWRPNVVHFQETSTDVNYLLWVLSVGFPRVLTVHDAEPHPGDFRPGRSDFYSKRMRQQADKLIVHSESIKKQLLKAERSSPCDIAVVPHVNLPVNRLGPARASRPIRFLLVGRMNAYKGAEILADAAISLSQRRLDFECLIAGAGPSMSLLKRRTDKTPQIVLIDKFLLPEEMDELLCSADCLVLPYIEASSSGILAQAMSIGLPAIATNVGSFSEYIESGDSGWIIPPADPASLAVAMEAVLSDPDKLRSASESLSARSKMFSPQRVGSILHDIYLSI